MFNRTEEEEEEEENILFFEIIIIKKKVALFFLSLPFDSTRKSPSKDQLPLIRPVYRAASRAGAPKAIEIAQQTFFLLLLLFLFLLLL